MFGVPRRFTATFTGASSALVGVLPRSPVVPGGESNQVSSVTFHRTYSMPEILLDVNLLFELLFIFLLGPDSVAEPLSEA